MTPAITVLTDAGIDFVTLEYDHDDSGRDYGTDAAAKTGLDPDQVFKTLLVSYPDDGGRAGHAVAIVPVSCMLSLKHLGGAIGRKKLAMCDPADAERITGYVVGGISPFGQRRLLPTAIDEIATVFDRIYVSGGRRGLEIGIAPSDLIDILGAAVAPIATAARSGG